MPYTVEYYAPQKHRGTILLSTVDTPLGKLSAARLLNTVEEQNGSFLCWLAFTSPSFSLETEAKKLQTDFPKHLVETTPTDTVLTNWVDSILTPGNKTSIPLILKGTPFQLAVWSALLSIKWGATCSYQELAQKVNKPKASRAVGSAVGKNIIAIAVPCHRIIRSDGSLGGYAGGLDNKKAILRREGQHLDIQEQKKMHLEQPS